MIPFTKEQLLLIAEAVEDYGVLVDEDSADKCGEILDTIEAYLTNYEDQCDIMIESLNFQGNVTTFIGFAGVGATIITLVVAFRRFFRYSYSIDRMTKDE